MTDRSDWKQLDDEKWSKRRAELLGVKGGPEQEWFLEAARDGEAFVREMDRIPVIGERSPDLYPSRLSEAQFKNSPDGTEARMYDLWKELPPAVASRTSFWTNFTMEHVRSELIEASYLASNGVSSQTGAERIDRALSRSDPKPDVRMDDCVRSVLRQLGGLPHVRGNRSVLVDCPFARAWWRERLLRSAEQSSETPKAKIGETLRASKGHWEWFVSAMVSKNPVFGMSVVQNAVAASLARLLPRSPEERPPPKEAVRDVCQAMCFLGSSRELGVLEFDELLHMTDSIAEAFRDDGG